MRETDVFDRFSDAYEAMIDWPKRLAREGPFFQDIFRSIGAGRVLDAACGTGHHAAMFHQWGLEVEGADLSASMIQRCRQRFGQSERLRWEARPFDQPAEQGAFDAVVCVGNSLALVADDAALSRAVAAMLQSLRPGGALIVQILNLGRLPDGPCQWHKCVRSLSSGGQRLIIKGVHRCGSNGYVNMLVTDLASDPPTLWSDSSRLLGISAGQLAHALEEGGATSVRFYGGYDHSGYDPLQSPDLLAVAFR
jgi:SAM-dependent methyltransferase